MTTLKIPKKGYEKLTKEKARIIAHLIGDGCVFRSNHDYNAVYEVIDQELLDSFEKDMLKIYGLKLTKGFNPSGKIKSTTPFLRLRSKLVYEDLLRYAPSYFSKEWKIGNELMLSPKEIKREFLRAFSDDEGSVIGGAVKIVRLYSINLEGLKQIQKILLDFNIESKIVKGFGAKRNVYAVVIKDLHLFAKEIGFSLNRKKEKLDELVESKNL